MTATAPSSVSPRQQFLNAFERECATTLRVLRAYPKGKESLKPHPKCKDAVNLAWIFVGEMGMMQTGITTDFDWSNPPKMPPTPATMDEVIGAFEQMAAAASRTVAGMTDEELTGGVVHFPSGPGKMATPSRLDFLWFVLSDQIHHRGQFSIYLRMADGKLPSIYGPTADEPWM